MGLLTRGRSVRCLAATRRWCLVRRSAVVSTHRRIRLFHVPSGRIILGGASAFWFLANRRGLVLVPIAARQDTQQHQCAESGWNGSLNTHYGISFLVRGAHQRASGHAVCWLVVPPTMGGAPDGLPPGLPGGATILPEVLGCSGGSELGMVLPALPVCCESEFFVSDGCEQAPNKATTVQSAAAAGHAIYRLEFTW